MLGRPGPRPGATPQQSADARQQDGELGGLGQIVVGASRESLQDVFGSPPRGEDEHRDEIPGRPQLRHDGEPVLAGQHHVEHDEVDGGGIVLQPVQRALPRIDDIGIVAFGFEVEAQPFGEMLFVFDDEDALRHGCGC
jgi:hypothetical protein